MNTRVICTCATLALCLPRLAVAQSWDGTWKLNLAKSHYTGTTFVIEDKGNGMMRVGEGADAYEFACDGKPYVIRANSTDTCTGSVKSGYDDVIKIKDKVAARQHSVFSADGNTLTMEEVDIRPDGTTTTDKTVLHRLSGTTGLVGKWMVAKADFDHDITFVMQTKGDWVTFYDPAYKIAEEGNMDGSPLKRTGPDLTPDVTHLVKREGPNKLHETFQYKGKITSETIKTLNADGKSISEVSWAPGKMDEKSTLVWERQ